MRGIFAVITMGMLIAAIIVFSYPAWSEAIGKAMSDIDDSAIKLLAWMDRKQLLWMCAVVSFGAAGLITYKIVKWRSR